jgi:hypothetical protein
LFIAAMARAVGEEEENVQSRNVGGGVENMRQRLMRDGCVLALW